MFSSWYILFTGCFGAPQVLPYEGRHLPEQAAAAAALARIAEQRECERTVVEAIQAGDVARIEEVLEETKSAKYTSATVDYARTFLTMKHLQVRRTQLLSPIQA